MWAQVLCALACWAALLAALPARADHLLTLDPRAAQSLGPYGEAWIDATGQAGVDQVATDRRLPWAPTREGAVYALKPGIALWLRFKLEALDDSERWFVEVPYPAVNRVTLYTADRAGRWSPLTAGDSIPVAEWPVPHRHPLLPVALTPGTSQEFYVRVENPHSFGAPLVFTSERQLLRQEQRAALILGLYFGLAGLSVVLALVAAGSLRDPAFAWYALTVMLMGLSQASLTGIAGLHLWPRQAWWNDVAVLALPVMAVASLLWFFSVVISLRQRSRRLHLLLVGISAACAAVAVAILFVEPAWRVRLMVPAIVVTIHAGLLVVGWAAWRGDRHAGWLLAGLAPVLVGSMFPMARAWGLIPVGFWTLHGMQVGIAIELPVLLAVLTRRSQHRRENWRRLHALDRTDPATGLINGQVFMERLVRLIARSERLHLQSLVLIVDIANIEAVRRDFGDRSAEEMPLHVAGRLLSVAREIDSVARLSEHRFGILVEGPMSPEDASATAPKVVARCLMPFKGKPLEWVAQVRVVQTQVPNGSDATKVVARLEAVLAAVPAESKRAVFTIR